MKNSLSPSVLLLLASASLSASTQAQTQWLPAQVTAPYRGAGAMSARASVNDELVLFGGVLAGVYQNDTWRYTGTAWQQVLPATSPTPRSGHRLAPNTGAGTLLLFGGVSVAGYQNDTWVFTGTNWIQVPSSLPLPGPRINHAMVNYQGSVVLFGGVGTQYFGDTWKWNGVFWQQQFLGSPPSPRYGHAMAYDPITDRILLFGGVGVGGVLLNDTWAYNGFSWQQLTVANPPPADFNMGVATDKYRRRIVILNVFGSTYEWTGTDYVLRSATFPGTVTRSDAMAYLSQSLSSTNTRPGAVVDLSSTNAYEYAPANFGRFSLFGTSAGPQVTTNGDCTHVPWKGQTSSIRATNFNTSLPAPFLIVSVASFNFPNGLDLAPFGAPGYFLYADPVAGFIVPSSFVGATATVGVAVPNHVAVGSTFYFQYFQLDAGANALGIRFSNAAQGIVGGL